MVPWVGDRLFLPCWDWIGPCAAVPCGHHLLPRAKPVPLGWLPPLPAVVWHFLDRLQRCRRSRRGTLRGCYRLRRCIGLSSTMGIRTWPGSLASTDRWMMKPWLRWTIWPLLWRWISPDLVVAP